MDLPFSIIIFTALALNSSSYLFCLLLPIFLDLHDYIIQSRGYVRQSQHNSNIGEVTDLSTGVYTGGIVGYDGRASVTNCYCINCYESKFGEFVTVSDMKEKETFFGWNFSTIWGIDSETNTGFPYLRGVEPLIHADVEILSYDGTTVKVYSKTSYNDIRVFIVAYDEGKPLSFKQTTANLTANKANSIPLTFGYTNDIKIFIWKSSGSLEPLCDPWN